jgi:hypothetical protein
VIYEVPKSAIKSVLLQRSSKGLHDDAPDVGTKPDHFTHRVERPKAKAVAVDEYATA